MWKNYSLSPKKKKERIEIKKEIQHTIKSFVLFMWCIHAFRSSEKKVRFVWVLNGKSIEWVSVFRMKESSVKSQMKIILSWIYWVLRVKTRAHSKWKWKFFIWPDHNIKPGQTFLDWMSPKKWGRQSASFHIVTVDMA